MTVSTVVTVLMVLTLAAASTAAAQPAKSQAPFDVQATSPHHVEMTVDRALALDRSHLPVQGPPGSGKTYRAARIIVAAIRDQMLPAYRKFADGHEAIVGNQTGGDSMYKAVILRELLNKGEVNTDAIKSRISDSGVINEAVFNNAVGVIEDYVKTGGKNLEGGTGLAGR